MSERCETDKTPQAKANATDKFNSIARHNQRHCLFDNAATTNQAIFSAIFNSLLVHAALVTGCRYGELCGLRVAHFDSDRGLLHVSKSKNGRTRDVTLAHEGQELFRKLSRMKLPEVMLLSKADSVAWGKSEQSRRMKAACLKAGLEPLGFHQLRHTYASLLIMNGVRTILVAQNLGHRDTRMVERHYGHLTDSYRSEMIRSLSPTFNA